MVARRARLDPPRPRQVAGERAADGPPNGVASGDAKQRAPIRRLKGEHLTGRRERCLDDRERGRGGGGQNQLVRLIIADPGEFG